MKSEIITSRISCKKDRRTHETTMEKVMRVVGSGVLKKKEKGRSRGLLISLPGIFFSV